MKKEQLTVDSRSDGLKLNVSIFVPDKAIRGIVAFSHGMVEHQTYYYDFMKFLTKVGYVTVIHDHRGHGKSVWNENDLGYFYEEKADYVIEDLHQIIQMMRDKYPQTPVYLFGHSMGSLIARKYLKKYDDEVEKVILCGSPSKNSFASMGQKICRLMKKMKGDHYRSKFLNGLALTNKPAETWLTINKDYVEEYKKDKYCNYIFTVNGFINLTQLMMDTYSKKGWKINNSKLDIFFIVGGNDKVAKSEKAFLKSVQFLKDIGYSNITYKIYYGCKHAIFKDKPDEVFADVLAFLEK